MAFEADKERPMIYSRGRAVHAESEGISQRMAQKRVKALVDKGFLVRLSPGYIGHRAEYQLLLYNGQSDGRTQVLPLLSERENYSVQKGELQRTKERTTVPPTNETSNPILTGPNLERFSKFKEALIPRLGHLISYKPNINKILDRCETNGWTITTLAETLNSQAWPQDAQGGLLIYRLQELARERPTRQVGEGRNFWPKWCGQCQEDTRQVLTDPDKPRRCLVCHPLSV